MGRNIHHHGVLYSKSLETTMYKNRIFVKLPWIYKRILYKQKMMVMKTFYWVHKEINAHDMILGRKKTGQKTQYYPSYVRYSIAVKVCVCVYK